MASSRALASALILFVTLSPARAQTPAFDKAREAFREGIKRPAIADRCAAIHGLVETKDVRATEDLIATLRVQEQNIAKKREEIEKVGKENREAWKPLDDYIEQERKKGDKGNTSLVPAEIVDRVEKKAKVLEAKLKTLNHELLQAEATRGALHEGIGLLMAGADPAARSPKVLEIASAMQKASSFDEKLFFIRILAVIRANESRDALIELARLSQDGQVRCVAVTALGDLEDPTAIPTLSKALEDEAWPVRTAAAQALALIPSVDSVPALAEALGKAEGSTTDAFMKALEDITGVTFFDNAALWKDWFSKEGEDIKKALGDLASGEPMIRKAGMNALVGKGTLAGVRLMLRDEGLDPPRDVKSKIKRSAIGASETRPAAGDEVQTRREAIAKLLQSRPKAIKDRAIPTLLIEPVAHSRELDDEVLEERYIRVASSLQHRDVLGPRAPDHAERPQGLLDEIASHIPFGDKAETEERLRRAAIEGLGQQSLDEAVDILDRVLRGDKTSKEAKLLCVAALEKLRRQACVRPLINALGDKGEVAEAATRSLKALTNQDFGSDRTAWSNWWNEKGKETAGLATRKSLDEKEAEAKEEQKKGGTTFYGITTHSKRIVYVLDISGSMNEDDSKQATGVTGGTKIQVAKRELKASVASLPEDAIFDIIVFADGFQMWKPKLMTATKEVKAECNKWIDAIKAAGGTNIFDALERAFELAGRGTVDKRYSLNVDTIMFMSDGQPNRGRLVQPSQIIAEIARMNENKKVTIHTIGVGKDQDVELMKRLARLNGGVYVAK